MPPDTFTSITIPQSTFDKFVHLYKIEKECGTLNPGICSFSAYFAEQLDNHIKEKKSLVTFANKILFVPKKFTETKLVLNKSELDLLFTNYK